MSVNETSAHQTHTQDAPASRGGDSGAARTRRVRDYLSAVPLIGGGLTIAVILLIVPWGERNQLDYASLAPIRDSMWLGIALDALMMAAVGVGLALVVCRAVGAKGARLAEVGAVLTAAGGICFAVGMYFFGSLAWYATDPALLDPAAGAAIMDAAVASPGHGMLLTPIGFLTSTLGLVLLCVALIRSRALPLWLPITILTMTVAVMFAPNVVKDYVQAVQMVLLAGIGVLFLRSRR